MVERTFLIDGRTFTASQVELAERLIFKDKTFAARGTPVFGLIKLLRAGGQRTAGEIAEQRRARQLQDEQAFEAVRQQSPLFLKQQEQKAQTEKFGRFITTSGGQREFQFTSTSLPSAGDVETFRRIDSRRGPIERPQQTREEFISKQSEDFGAVPDPLGRRETRTDLAPQFEEREVRTQPFVEQRQIGTKTTKTGKKIPVTETVFVDPTVEGRQFERPATEKERKALRGQIEAVRAEPQISPAQKAFRGIQSEIENVKAVRQDIVTRTTTPLFEKPIELTKDLGLIGGQAVLAKTGVSPKSQLGQKIITETGEVSRGAVGGVLEDIRDRPFVNLATAGIGVAIGAGIIGGKAAAGVVGRKVGGVLVKDPIRGKVLGQQLFTVAEVGTGVALTGKFVADKSLQISVAPTTRERSRVIGRGTKELALLGAGGFVGAKVATKGLGLRRTRGLEEVPFEQLSPEFKTEATFPELKSGETAQQFVARFRQPRLPGETPGQLRGFTATDLPELATVQEIATGKFITVKGRGKRDILTGRSISGKETIKSEFPGRFIADVPSPQFLRAGKESKKTRLFGLFEDIGGEPTLIRTTLKDIKIPRSQQGRVSRSPERILEVQEALGGRRGLTPEEIARLEPTLKSGEAIAPLIKTEREVIQVRGPTDDIVTKRFFTVEPETGARVPIFERVPRDLTTVKRQRPSRQTIKRSKDLTKELESISEPGRFRRQASITPSRVIGSSVLRGSKVPSSSKLSSIAKSSSKLNLGSDVSRPSKVSNISKISSNISRPSRISSIAGIPSRIPSSSIINNNRLFKTPSTPSFQQIKKKKKQRTSEGFLKEDIVLAEGFTAKTLGLKPVKIKLKDVGKASKGGLGVRRAPIIVR